MNTINFPVETANTDAVTANQIDLRPSETITTTLYDLVAAVQSAVEPEEEELVVPMVMRLLHSGRVTLPTYASAQVA